MCPARKGPRPHARAPEQCPRIEVVILAEAQGLVVAQAMPVEENAPHHRFQEADLAARGAAPGNIAVDEALDGEETRGRLEAGHLRFGAGCAALVDEDDIVGDEIPVLPVQHGVETAAQEEVVCIQYGNERRA